MLRVYKHACSRILPLVSTIDFEERVNKFSLILKLIPNKYGQTVSEVAIEWYS